MPHSVVGECVNSESFPRCSQVSSVPRNVPRAGLMKPRRLLTSPRPELTRNIGNSGCNAEIRRRRMIARTVRQPTCGQSRQGANAPARSRPIYERVHGLSIAAGTIPIPSER